MKSFTPFFIALSIMLVKGTAPAFAQQQPKEISIGAPKVINFKELAEYRLSHPIMRKDFPVEQGEDIDKDIVHNRTVGSNALSFNVNVPKAVSRSTSPAATTVFTSTTENGFVVPPDVQAAAGPNYVMVTNNQEFDIYAKNGTYVSTLDIPTFFNGINVDVEFSDPHVVYDPRYKRFVAVIDPVELSDYNDDGGWGIAVSETSDPTGNWYIYTYDDGIVEDYSSGGDDILDYPLLGFNKNWVVVTGNLFSDGSLSTISEITVFNRAKLYGGTLGTVYNFSDDSVFTYAPAVTFDTAEATEYMVADDNGNNNGNGYMYIGTITGTPTAPVYSLTQTIGVNSTWDENEVDANQPDGATPITTDDTRIGNSIYRNGSLWFAHTVYLPAGNPSYSGVDWWQVNPATPSVTQYGRISDPNGIAFNFYPSVCVDSLGNALVGYTTCSPNVYASAEYSFHAVTDAKNAMEGGYIYAAGQASYDNSGSGRNRWGDFSYTFMDPSNGTFWTAQEYAESPANTWGISVANIVTAPCKSKPAAGIISSMADTVCNSGSELLSLIGYTSGSTGITILWQQSLNGTTGWSNVTGGIGDSTDTYTSAPLTATTYFRAVVSCVNSGLHDTSNVYKVLVPGISSVSPAKDTLCSPKNITLTANANDGPVNWYANSSATKIIANGTTLNAYVNSDTTFYVNTGTLNQYTDGIADDNSGSGSYYNYDYDYGLLFTAMSSFTLDSLSVYANSTGDVTVNLINVDNGSTVGTITVTINANQVGNAVSIPTAFSCMAGTDYNITAGGTTVSALFRTSAGANYPYVVPNVVSITGANNQASGHYYFFYNWYLSSGCMSPLVAVPVKYNPLSVKATAKPDTLCSGSSDSILLTASGAASYQWSPTNATTSSIYVKPTVTTTYTVTGSNTKGCSGQGSVKVYVESCTDINSPAANNPTVEVFPNPTTGQFDMALNNLPANNYSVELYNILGEKLSEKLILVNQAQYTLQMDVSSFPPGVYLIRVMNSNLELSKTVIKR